jgi:quinol-cytochrome oxidoreductase complex cytochrome b subunit
LVRFYTWHIFGLTLVFVILAVWHLFKVRRDGGIAVPPPEYRLDPSRIPRGELVRREALAALLAGTGLVLLSILFPAPTGAQISDVLVSDLEANAPWFFLWIQQLLKLGDPFTWGVLTPLLFLLILAMLPYVLPAARPAELGRWFPSSGRPAQILVACLAAFLIVLSLIQIIPSG